MNVFLETERLVLRRIGHGDFSDVAAMLQDPRVMYAWEHAFTDEEVREWIEKNLARYAACGLAHFLAVEKRNGRAVGYAGLLQDTVNGRACHEISYMLRYDCWHCGFAREAAAALAHYAFSHLGLTEVIFEIRPENRPSIRVAESLGAVRTSAFLKRYRGKDMLHDVYSLRP